MSLRIALKRSAVLAGTFTLLLSSAAMAQPSRDNRGFANRTVDGTVASVVHANNGDHVRLTNGMDLLVPTSITGTNQGRRYAASTLRPGDVVRMSVYSREGDGRDARVRSLEILQTRSGYNNRNNRINRNNNFGGLLGTVVSFDRRADAMVVRTDNGRVVDVDMRAFAGRNTSMSSFRRGDRVSLTGRTNREGTFMADDIRMDNGQNGQYDRRR